MDTLNNSNLKRTLDLAYNVAKKTSDSEDFIDSEVPVKELIDTVVSGSHKTFRYILITALLAKATSDAVNPLSLQAGSQLQGAYDARSVCHKVVVPFEREFLNNALGGSNEPFLNKPARFPELSKNNAVRRGADRKLLFLLCDELPTLKTSREAFKALVYMIAILLDIARTDSIQVAFRAEDFVNDYSAICVFVDQILDHNCGGEILTLVITATLSEYFKNDPAYTVEPHHINQSGASSREISDLDVYHKKNIFALFELKDKNFTEHDIMHAVRKAREGGHNTLNFVYGRFARFDVPTVESLQQKLLNDSFVLNVLSAEHLVPALLSLVNDLSVQRFINTMLSTASDSHFSQESTVQVLNLAERIFKVDASDS